jgi:deoxyribodipyrimidine photo-lyase
MKTAIWWIRRDLRLTDNQTLYAALEQADEIVPVFIIDPGLLDSPYAGDKPWAFLLGGLRQLDSALRERTSRLIVRRGDPINELGKLLSETGAEAVFAEEDFSPYACHRDQQVASRFSLHLSPGLTVHPPGVVLKQDRTSYTVFTPFSKSWKERLLPSESDILPVPDSIRTPSDLSSQALPDGLTGVAAFSSGEAKAQCRLTAFVDGDQPPIYAYADRRNRMDLDGTSSLSPYLRFGMLSARQAVVAAHTAIKRAPTPTAQQGAETWLNELIWREFYINILYHFPHVRGNSFRERYRSVPWRNDESEFTAWCEGRTGYPVVDAAMRQLVQTGWMHNRVRMIAASFLVKDLLIDWRWGERFFMQHLIDGDPAANNGGWQWTAGTGTDAAPYFRIFNPVTQGQKFDPGGIYVRRWVAELAEVPDRYIQKPWEMPFDVQQMAGCIIGEAYPSPIVDHSQARERTLEAYDKVKRA